MYFDAFETVCRMGIPFDDVLLLLQIDFARHWRGWGEVVGLVKDGPDKLIREN